jgi:hypothetical protein
MEPKKDIKQFIIKLMDDTVQSMTPQELMMKPKILQFATSLGIEWRGIS